MTVLIKPSLEPVPKADAKPFFDPAKDTVDGTDDEIVLVQFCVDILVSSCLCYNCSITLR